MILRKRTVTNCVPEFKNIKIRYIAVGFEALKLIHKRYIWMKTLIPNDLKQNKVK